MLVGGLAVLSGLSFLGAVGAITCGVLLGNDRLYDRGDRRRRLRAARPGCNPHGLWHARRQMGAQAGYGGFVREYGLI